MKGYKATYNMKCETLTYEVGKTYLIDNMEMCSHGFHFCEDMIHTLNYYKHTKDFILLEVEALGEVETRGDKSVTNKLKILRVVPPEEYSEAMKKVVSIYEYDGRGNMISETYPSGNKYTYEYDEKDNMISKTYPNGERVTYEYDGRGNKISKTYPDGNKYTYEYDERGNKISKTYPDGKSWSITIA